jgi:hypothetical protein
MSDDRVQEYIDQLNASRGRPPEGWEEDAGDDRDDRDDGDDGEADPFARHGPSDPLKGLSLRG